MGFLTDLILPEPILRFTNEGIVCPKDNGVIPWSSVSEYEVSEDGMSLTVKFWGGLKFVACAQQAFFRVDDQFEQPTLGVDHGDASYLSKDAEEFTEEDVSNAYSDLEISIGTILAMAKTLQVKPFGQCVIEDDTTQMASIFLALAGAIRRSFECGSNEYEGYLDWLRDVGNMLAQNFQEETLNGLSVAEGRKTAEGQLFADICHMMIRLAPSDKKYLWRHNVRVYGRDRYEDDFEEILVDGECSMKSGLNRKILVCNSEPVHVSKIEDDTDVLVVMSDEIEKFNDSVKKEAKLIFQPGHPQSGVTYVQHPLQENLYFEVNSFHESILERKQNELLKVFESIGAYSAKVEVFNEERKSSRGTKGTHFNASGSHGVVSGAVTSDNSSERDENVMTSRHATKDWQFNPPRRPALPKGLVFYPSEETWQQMVDSVMRGGLKQAVVDLEYKTEYGITEKYLKDVSVSAKSLIPSYEMNLKQEFSSDLQRLSTTRWHYDVVFEDEHGQRAGGKRAGNTHPDIVREENQKGQSKAEFLFLKRAKRYAESEGRIDANQRDDLESFAQKYGIDGLRMEELIEEAFE